MPYRFEYDPESGAFYIRVRDGEYHETIPLGEPGFGASVDVDAEGNVLGFEFLSFEEYVELIDHAGSLEVPERLEPKPVEEDPPPSVDHRHHASKGAAEVASAKWLVLGQLPRTPLWRSSACPIAPPRRA